MCSTFQFIDSWFGNQHFVCFFNNHFCGQFKCGEKITCSAFPRLTLYSPALAIHTLTDSLYQKDRVGFSSNVEQEERRLIEQAELLRLAGEREKEAKTLKEQAGRRVRKP